MFSGWMNVRMRAAEKALAHGRLDEAFAAATAPEARDDRRAERLLDELAKPLLARARLHAQAGRYREALDDLARLLSVKRGGADADALRRRCTDELRERNQRDVGRHDAEARAVENIQAGRLESGRLAVERVEDTQRREHLREQLDIRVQRSEQLVEQARASLSSGDVLTACRFWEEACSRHGRSLATDALAAQLVPAYRDFMDECFSAGKLDRFEAALRATPALRQFDVTLDEFDRLASLAAQAAQHLSPAQCTIARDALLKLSAARGAARWVQSALQSVADILAKHELLMASPLALARRGVEKNAEIVAAAAAPQRYSDNAEPPASPRDAGAALSGVSLLLLLDGTGSSLLLSRDTVRIGRAGAGNDVDVPIPADLQSHHADIVRAGEDYFLVAHGPVLVNRRAVRRALLREGDRIVLGGSGKMVFHKPSTRSETAVLKLSDRCRLPQDVSVVLLFKETCLVGPHASCHLQTRDGESRVVLFDRGGRLFARRAAIDGRPLDAAEPVELGRTVQVGDQRLTVKAYEALDSKRMA